MERVLQVLSGSPVHLTAEEILKSINDVGRATVYRALDRLTEEGIIHRLSLEHGASVYEYVRKPHMHFRCSQCGKLYDIPGDAGEAIAVAMMQSGHRIERTDVISYGICFNCLNQTQNTKMEETKND